MPHQCVRCGSLYDDGSQSIIQGCTCGARLFFYVKPDAIARAQEMTADLSEKDKEQIEKDVFDLVGISPEKEEAVVLDFESIRIMKPGKFEIDLIKLFDKNKPLVYKLEEGKYVIDLPETFSRKK